jgi:hypothetical protein
MPKDFVGFLNVKTERGKNVAKVFGKTEVYLKSPVPERISWNGQVKVAYQIDLAMYPAEIIDRLANHLSQRFNVPVADVKHDLPQIGCPLLSEEVTVAIPMRYFE